MNVRESSASSPPNLGGGSYTEQGRAEWGFPIGGSFRPLSLAPLLAIGDGALYFGTALLFAAAVWWLFIHIPERRDVWDREEQHAEERRREIDLAVPVWSRTPLYDWQQDEAPGTGVYGHPRRRSEDA